MAFNRVNIDGTLVGGAERFTVGVAYQGSASSAVTDSGALSAWADRIMGAFNGAAGTWGPTLRANVGSTSTISRVRIYAYDAPGGSATALGQSSVASVAGSGTVLLPPQCSVVASLLTNVPGRRTRGRMYWPFLAGVISSGGTFAGPTSPANLAVAFASMLASIGNLAESTINPRPVIVSVAGNVVTPVTSVSVGNVIDTQRRRRDSIVETRSFANVPA